MKNFEFNDYINQLEQKYVTFLDEIEVFNS